MRSKFQHRCKAQAIIRSNADPIATYAQAYGHPSVASISETEKGLITISFKNPGSSPVLLASTGKVQVSFATEEELEELVRALRTILVPMEGEELRLVMERRIPFPDDVWDVYNSLEKAKREFHPHWGRRPGEPIQPPPKRLPEPFHVPPIEVFTYNFLLQHYQDGLAFNPSRLDESGREILKNFEEFMEDRRRYVAESDGEDLKKIGEFMKEFRGDAAKR